MKRLWVVGILFLAFAGLADSFYLAQHKNGGTPLLCDIQNLSDCNIVATSKYSAIFGISVADLGIVYYGVLFALAALEIVVFNRLLRRVLQVLAAVGLLMSLYSTMVQFFFIQALCIYCLASALITVFIFILASFIEPLRRSMGTLAPASAATPGVSRDTLPMPPS